MNNKSESAMPCCEPDYEAEYNRLMERHHKQGCELQAYKEKFQYLEQENRELKARMDMVYLIFGGRNHG